MIKSKRDVTFYKYNDRIGLYRRFYRIFRYNGVFYTVYSRLGIDVGAGFGIYCVNLNLKYKREI